MRLFDLESRMRHEEQIGLLSLTRSKKKLAALEDEEISLSRERRRVFVHPGNGVKATDTETGPLSKQLDEVSKLIEAESLLIRDTQAKLRMQALQAHKDREDLQRSLQFEAQKQTQLIAHHDRFIDQLQQKLHAVEFARRFPGLESVIGPNSENSEMKKLEAKLDVIMRELAEIKKHHAKP
jgi:hypothetical protein